MKRLINKKGMKAVRILIVAAWVLTVPFIGKAQDAGPWSVIYEGLGYSGSDTDEGGSSSTGTEEDGSGGTAFDDNVADYVPVDGGLSLLLAAGAAYGARRLRRRRREDDRS